MAEADQPKSSFLSVARPVVGTSASALALSGAAGAATVGSYFSAAVGGIGAFGATLFATAGALAAVIGPLASVGIGLGLLTLLIYKAEGQGIAGKAKGLLKMGTNQMHPFESAALGIKGRLGSMLWQGPLLYFLGMGAVAAATGGASAFFPGVLEAGSGFLDLMVAGLPIGGEAVSEMASATTDFATPYVEQAIDGIRDLT